MTGIAASPSVPAIGSPVQRILASSNQTAKAAQKFEAMAISQLLKPIFATMGKADAPFGGGAVAKEFQPFLIEAIAKSIETRGGLGLTPMIETAITRQSATSTPIHPKTGTTP